MRGRRLYELIAEAQVAGYHSVTWDRRLGSGSQAASGVYFARITTPIGVATEKMTLIK